MYQKLQVQVKQGIDAYFAIPLLPRIGGTLLALIIIIDGAVLFFNICGAFGYLKKRTQAIILEESIQIINAAFSIICAIELPYRIRAAYYWTCQTLLLRNQSTQGNSLSKTSKYALFLRLNYPWSMNHWTLFGVLTYGKIFQSCCQFMVEYLCLAYAGLDQFENRPATLFTIFICFALPLGCIIGITEGIYSNSTPVDSPIDEDVDMIKNELSYDTENHMLASSIDALGNGQENSI